MTCKILYFRMLAVDLLVYCRGLFVPHLKEFASWCGANDCGLSLKSTSGKLLLLCAGPMACVTYAMWIGEMPALRLTLLHADELRNVRAFGLLCCCIQANSRKKGTL
jgi:hypothetical protein